MSIKQIYEGWRNNLFPPEKMKDVINSTSNERMKICNDCPHYSSNAKKDGYKTLRPDEHCIDCGCTLAAKTKCLSCECPIGKWKALMTEKQEDEIEKSWITTKENK